MIIKECHKFEILRENNYSHVIFVFEQNFLIVDRFSKFLLHNLGQTKHWILQGNILPTIKLFRKYMRNTIIRDKKSHFSNSSLQLQNLLHLFKSPHLQEHLRYVLVNADIRSSEEEEKVKLSKKRSDNAAKDVRSTLYSRIGLSIEKDSGNCHDMKMFYLKLWKKFSDYAAKNERSRPHAKIGLLKE